MAPYSSTLAWKIPWMEEPGRLQSMGSPRVGCNWATSLSLFSFMHWRRKWQPTPVFLPGESQGRGSLVGGRPWVAQSWTWLKRLSSSSSRGTVGHETRKDRQRSGHEELMILRSWTITGRCLGQCLPTWPTDRYRPIFFLKKLGHLNQISTNTYYRFKGKQYITYLWYLPKFQLNLSLNTGIPVLGIYNTDRLFLK